MQSMMEQLYEQAISGLGICPPKYHTQQEEDTAYDALLSVLSDKQKKLFFKFLDIYADHLSDDAERMYYLGLQQGILLITEIHHFLK